jgi:GNAT superfamily N-acetyltransferase
VNHRLDFTDDPRVFLTRASAWLERDPVLSTVLATSTARAVEDLEAGRKGPPGQPRWWVTISTADGEVVGVAARTAPFRPFPLYVLPMPDDAARQLAARLVQRGETIAAVNGALPTAEEVALEIARRTGRRAHVHEHTRLHVLGRLVEPAYPDGGPRLARSIDTTLATAWFEAFHRDAAAQAGRLRLPGTENQFDIPEVRTRIDAGRLWLWEDGLGKRMSMVGFNPPSLGVARIGPVYTPAEHRGRGFASALTAHVSRLLRDAGARVCLYTDQANPTSNKIYAAIGYEPVADMANLVITRAVPPVPKVPARRPVPR